MAKLSAHGYEVARVVYRDEVPTTEFDRSLYGEDHTVSRYEYHVSFRSDGHIMQRIVGLDTHPGEANPSLRRHDWGWKLWKKVQKGDNTIGRVAVLASNMTTNCERKGTLISSTVAE
jgi:hypothetical protein